MEDFADTPAPSAGPNSPPNSGPNAGAAPAPGSAIGRSSHREGAPARALPEEEGGVDLARTLNIMWRGKWAIAACAVLAASIAFVSVKQTTPIYAAHALVLVEGNKQQFVEGATVVSGVDTSLDGLSSEAEVVRSDQLADRVIRNLRLDADPEFNGAIRAVAPSLSERIVSLGSPALAAALFGERSPVATPPLRALDEDGLAPVRAAFKSRLSVRPRGRTKALRITFESTDPAKAQLIANTIADQYIIDQLETRFERTQRATLWLSERIGDLRSRVSGAEKKVEDYKAEIAATSGASVDVTRAQLSELTSSLVEARARRAEAEARYTQVRLLAQRGGDLTGASDVQSSTAIQELRGQLAAFRRDANALSKRYGPKHPDMVNLRSKIAQIAAVLRAETRKVVAALGSEAEVARAREQSLQESVDALQGRSLNQNQAGLRLRELEREAQASRLIYENFLSRFKEASQQQTLQEAEARIIERAAAPGAPIKPNVSRSVSIGGVLGAGLGLALVFLLERLNNTFRHRAELEARTGLPVLASTPSVGRKRRRDIFAYFEERPNSSLAEAVRNLRTSLLLSNVDSPPKVALVTSSAPSEGKSILSLLLASTAARSGKSAILVDCDMRRPTVHELFPSENGFDLVSVLSGECELSAAVVGKMRAGSLCALPCRVAKGNPADLLSSKRFEALVATLRSKFDMVVLDSPPLSLVTDARIISTVADTTLVAVRWDETPKDLVVDAIRELQMVGADIAGAVLTIVDERQNARYNYGYRGRYGRYYDVGVEYYEN
ncbi:MAG: polysaccharide biosynthesis tyrosine autokinase [Pseudomonadota bacterium]